MATAAARLPEGHDDTGDDERGQELQQSATDAGDETQCRFCQLADLRLQTPHQRRQIRVSLRPKIVNLLADERPVFHVRARGWHLQRVVLHVTDQLVHRIA